MTCRIYQNRLLNENDVFGRTLWMTLYKRDVSEYRMPPPNRTYRSVCVWADTTMRRTGYDSGMVHTLTYEIEKDMYTMAANGYERMIFDQAYNFLRDKNAYVILNYAVERQYDDILAQIKIRYPNHYRSCLPSMACDRYTNELEPLFADADGGVLVGRVFEAYHFACRNGCLPLVVRCLPYLSQARRDIVSGIVGAAREGQLSVVQYLTTAFEIELEVLKEALYKATKNEHYDVARHLLDIVAPLNHDSTGSNH